eukprot:984519-Pyramimonas_sp.AAC.1
MHRRCIADALVMRRDPSTPSIRTPARRPLGRVFGCRIGGNCQVSDPPKRDRLRRHLRVSCPREGRA